MNEEQKDPDTNTDDNVSDDLGISEPSFPEAVPVADSAADETMAEQPAAPIALAGPRSFPQHYTLLFGSVMVFVAAISDWERAHVFGDATNGTSMISGTFLLAMSLYTMLVAFLNIQHGRLRGMMAAFITGAGALYLGIKKAIASWNETLFLSKEEISNYVTGGKKIPIREPFEANPELFPTAALDRFTDHKEIWGYFLGQYAPGVWWSIIGGTLIVLVFLKAFLPSKKAEPAPPPSRGRRRR